MNKIRGILALIVLGTVIGIVLTTQNPKSLYGSQVIYYAKFNSSTPAAVLTPKNMAFYDCTIEKSEVIVTADTIEIRTKKGIVGFKPLYLTKEPQLYAAAKDGTVVVFIRHLPKGKDPILSSEHLIIMVGHELLILNPTKDCLEEL